MGKKRMIDENTERMAFEKIVHDVRNQNPYGLCSFVQQTQCNAIGFIMMFPCVFLNFSFNRITYFMAVFQGLGDRHYRHIEFKCDLFKRYSFFHLNKVHRQRSLMCTIGTRQSGNIKPVNKDLWLLKIHNIFKCTLTFK